MQPQNPLQSTQDPQAPIPQVPAPQSLPAQPVQPTAQALPVQAPTTIQQPIPAAVPASPAPAQPFMPQSASGSTTSVHSNKSLIIAIFGVGAALLLITIIASTIFFVSHNKKAEVEREKEVAAAEAAKKQDKQITEVVKPPEVLQSNPSGPSASTVDDATYGQKFDADFMQDCNKEEGATEAWCKCMLSDIKSQVSYGQLKAYEVEAEKTGTFPAALQNIVIGSMQKCTFI